MIRAVTVHSFNETRSFGYGTSDQLSRRCPRCAAQTEGPFAALAQHIGALQVTSYDRIQDDEFLFASRDISAANDCIIA